MGNPIPKGGMDDSATQIVGSQSTISHPIPKDEDGIMGTTQTEGNRITGSKMFPKNEDGMTVPLKP